PQTYNTLFDFASCTSGPGAGFTGNQLTCPGAGSAAHSQYYYPGEKPFVLDYYGIGQEQEDELLTHYGLDLRYTLADGIQIRSLSGFVHIYINHQDNNSYAPWNAGWTYHEIGPNDNYMSQEIDIISPTSGKTNWLVGGFWNYRDTPVFVDNFVVTPPYQPGQQPAVLASLAFPSTNRIAAIFGQFNWQFTDTLQLQIGARENWDNNFSTQSTGAAVPGIPVTVPNGTGVYVILPPGPPCQYAVGVTPAGKCYLALSSSLAAGAFKDSVPTGKIDLNWTPVPGQNFYVFYARGYKSGGTNSGSTDHPVFNPEHVNDFELGWKGRLANGRMLTQVGGYYYNYQNMQYSLFDPQENGDTTTGTYVANLAASTIYGIEVSEQARFAGLGVNLGFSYNHSALGAVTTLPNYALPGGFGSPTTLPQCLAGHSYAPGTNCFDYTPYLVNVSGEENPFAPKVTGNISVDYMFHVGNGTIDPRVTFSHTDAQYDSIFEVPYNLMQARNLLDASIDWVVGRWDTQVFGTNLGNQTYIIAGGDPLYYGPPRQLGLQVLFHF
ncbi:MAG TPA: TonB-dependent receptor, partial [Steroidobacteraceae bacterium]|nr:TonB-dependent receptor [Steroidobacteraceae bacterium]